jgi:hypothetical protein
MFHLLSDDLDTQAMIPLGDLVDKYNQKYGVNLGHEWKNVGRPYFWLCVIFSIYNQFATGFNRDDSVSPETQRCEAQSILMRLGVPNIFVENGVVWSVPMETIMRSSSRCITRTQISDVLGMELLNIPQIQEGDGPELS